MAKVETRVRKKRKRSSSKTKRNFNVGKVDTGARVAYGMLLLLVAGIAIWALMKFRA